MSRLRMKTKYADYFRVTFIQNEQALRDTVHQSEMVTVVTCNPDTNEGAHRITID
jgi:hypothetical protein